MKKVLVGVGIGCGVLVVGAVVVVGAAGFWAKGKLEEVGGDLEARAARQEQAKKQIDALDAKYAFQAPPKGQPVRVEEGRLKEYLAVRTAMVPVFKAYEEKAKAFETKEGESPGLTEGLKAAAMMHDMVVDLQSAWLTHLDAQKMSPREYHAITAALYMSGAGQAIGEMKRGRRKTLEEVKAQLEQNADEEGLPAEARAQMLAQANELEAEIAKLPPEDQGPSDAEQRFAHNAALAEKYKVEVEQFANPVLDALLTGGEGLGEAFENIDLGDEGEEKQAEGTQY